MLAEPKSLAEATAKLPFGRKLTIEEVKGPWLRVSDGPSAGWVFRGNLAATKPAEIKGLLDGLPQTASQTTAAPTPHDPQTARAPTSTAGQTPDRRVRRIPEKYETTNIETTASTYGAADNHPASTIPR